MTKRTVEIGPPRWRSRKRKNGDRGEVLKTKYYFLKYEVRTSKETLDWVTGNRYRVRLPGIPKKVKTDDPKGYFKRLRERVEGLRVVLVGRFQ